MVNGQHHHNREEGGEEGGEGRVREGEGEGRGGGERGRTSKANAPYHLSSRSISLFVFESGHLEIDKLAYLLDSLVCSLLLFSCIYLTHLPLFTQI